MWSARHIRPASALRSVAGSGARPTRGVLCVARACRCGDKLERRLQLSSAWRSCMRATLSKLAAAVERCVGAELSAVASLRACSVCVLRSGAMRVVCRRRQSAVSPRRLCTRATPPNLVVVAEKTRVHAQSRVLRGVVYTRATHGQSCVVGVLLHVGRPSPAWQCRPWHAGGCASAAPLRQLPV